MTTNHTINKNDFYQQQGLIRIQQVLQSHIRDRNTAYYTLVTLCNLLMDDPLAEYSIMRARQYCLENHVGDQLSKIEQWYSDDTQIITYTTNILKFIYSNWS